MKTISLSSIEIKNFKGISDFSTTFTDRVEIYGRNGLGKTSILDAFLWCLFGKDSTGASSFSVKPLNEDGTIKDHHDVDVMCVLSIDGVEKSFRRKWIEKRSKKGDEFKGNEGAYFVNEVPMKDSEYSRIISEICREDLFKLITSTGSFNRMKDSDKRMVLAGMSDKFYDMDIAEGMTNVLKALEEGKTIDQFKAEVKAKKNRAELELEQYPTRLKENADSRPIVPDDISTYQDRINRLLEDIDKFDKILAGSSNSTLVDDKKKELQSHKEFLFDIERQCRKELDAKREQITKDIADIDNTIFNAQKRKALTMSMITPLKSNIALHTKDLERITQEWRRVNESTVDAHIDAVCPTCGKAFSEYDMDVRRNEIIRAFNEDKLKRLDEINKRGVSESEFIKGMEAQIEEYNNILLGIDAEIASCTSNKAGKSLELDKVPTLATMISSHREYQLIKAKHDEAQRCLNEFEQPTSENLDIITKKIAAQEEVSRLKRELSKLDEIKRMDERKAELEQKQQEVGQLVATYKQIEAEILAFSMKKTSMIEQSVSSKFRFVKFKMFEYNLTNDGVREVCICTVNGVPYKDLNTAMQYNADIDIINALSSHYGIVAPVFIDRAESINSIEKTAGQRIDLYATKDDNTLRVEHILS